jgi:uncharacterized phage infection (PIP) family protein YhgE
MPEIVGLRQDEENTDDHEPKPFTVRYHLLTPLLLKEVIRLSRENEQMAQKIARLKQENEQMAQRIIQTNYKNEQLVQINQQLVQINQRLSQENEKLSDKMGIIFSKLDKIKKDF